MRGNTALEPAGVVVVVGGRRRRLVWEEELVPGPVAELHRHGIEAASLGCL